VSLPKNNDFARNIHGRLSSGIHRLNNGVADSADKNLVFLGIRLSEKAANSLYQNISETVLKKT
jgi:Na+/phosphate symporter